MTMFPDQLYQLGGVPIGGPIFRGGNHYFVDRTNGSDSYDGKSWTAAKKTLLAAYNLTADAHHDVVYMLESANHYPLAASLTWSKNFTHLIGIGAPLRTGGRVRICASANFTPMITFSGYGNVIANVHIQHGRGNAANLIGVNVSGDRNYFHGVQIESPNNATEAAAALAYRGMTLAIGAQDNTFAKCSFGCWTVLDTSTAGAQIAFLGDNGSTWFDDCLFQTFTDETGHLFVKTGVNLGGYNSMLSFRNCGFFNNSAVGSPGATMTVAMSGPTVGGGSIHISNCYGYGFTDWAETSGNGTRVFVSGAAVDEGSGIGTNPS